MGDSINPTTIWTPQSGFLDTPGVANPVTSPAGGGGGSGSGVYVAPNLIPTPACAFGPAATADSEECQKQVMAVQQQNFQLENNANRAVFVADCLNTVPQPTDCYTRTYGQTPAGGFTSDASTQGGQLILDAAGNVVSRVDPATGEPPVTKPAGGTTSGATSKIPANGGLTDSPHELLYWTIGLGVLGILIAAVNR
jgi:hypothetical protein